MTSVRAISTSMRQHSILAAALECFTSQGIQATTIERLRDHAGCSTGSIYHHFGNKEGVASELFLHGVRSLNANLMARLERCGSAEESVKAVVLEYSDWVSANPKLARFLLNSRDIAFTEAAKQELKRIYHEHRMRVHDWFTPFVLHGEIKLLPTETYIPIISGPIQDYARHWLMGRFSASPAAVQEVFAEAAWNAVRVNEP